jgi:hypothetical protein
MGFTGCPASVQMAEAPLLGPGGESRCSQCISKNFQCYGCQDVDKQQRITEKQRKKKGPTSPDKKMIDDTPRVLAAMNFASDSRILAEERLSVAMKYQERLHDEKRAVEKRKRDQKKQEKNSKQDAVSKASCAHEYDIEDIEEDTNLRTCAIVDEEVEVRDAGVLGRGVFALVVLRKGKYGCNYMGNRCFATGILAMECLKMQALIMALPDKLRGLLETTKYDSTWRVNVGNSRNAFTSIDGSIAASRHLDGIPKRAGFGVAALVNSCKDIIGQRPNCMFKWLKRSSTTFKMHNQYYGAGDDCADGVLEVTEDIQPGQQLFWDYNFHAVHGSTPKKVPRKKTDRQTPVETVRRALILSPVAPEIAVAKDVVVPAAQEAVKADDAVKIADDVADESAVVNSAIAQDEIDYQDFCDGAKIDDEETEVTGSGTQQRAVPIVPVQTRTEELLYQYGDPQKRVLSATVKTFIRDVHKMTPAVVLKEHRLSNITNLHSLSELKQWCLLQAARMTYARENHVKSCLSARDNVEACMRLLSIFSNDQSARTFYLQSRQLASAGELTAKEVDEDSVFWKYMESKFHDATYNLPFNYEYIPTAFSTMTLEKIRYEFNPPDRIAGGFLLAMDLLHGRKPSNYAPSYFSRIKLFQLWKGSLSDYRKSISGWKSSGVNMSRPLYHFVLPTTIFDPTKPLQTCGLNVPTKRWDTLAWYICEPCPCACCIQ